MRKPPLKCLTSLVLTLDPIVADMVRACEFDGQSICDWTCRLHHIYIELRAAWHDAGGRVGALPGDIPFGTLRLKADGSLTIPTNQPPEPDHV
jgi:hypothetical protein